MWNGQATIALTDWADKVSNEQKVAANQAKIASYNPDNDPLPSRTPTRKYRGKTNTVVSTDEIMGLHNQGWSGISIARHFKMNPNACRTRIRRALGKKY